MPSRSQLGNAAQITLVLDHDLHRKLGEYAAANGRSMLSVVRQALTEHIDRAQARRSADAAFEQLRPRLQDHIERDLQWGTAMAQLQREGAGGA